MRVMASPKVYIIILNWNGWEDTIECLESIFNINYDNYQVMVCDNFSSDNSVEYVKEWAKGNIKSKKNLQINKTIPLHCEKPISYIEIGNGTFDKARDSCGVSLLLIHTGKNLGFAGGNNVGIRYALAQEDGEFVWILNNDTVVDPDSLNALVNKSLESSNIGICGSVLKYYHNPTRIQAIGGTYNRFLGTTKSIVDLHNVRKVDLPTGASMLVSMKFLASVGLMSEDYFLYYEEIDWSIRGALYNFTIAYSLDSIVFHKEGAIIGGSNYSKNNKSLISDYYSIKNRLLFTKKYYPYYLPFVYLGLLITLLNRIRRKQIDRVWMIFKIILGKEFKVR